MAPKQDLDKDNEDAIEARVERGRAARKAASAGDVAPATTRASDEDDGGVIVDLDEDDDDDSAPAPERPSRKERRNDRVSSFKRDKEAAEERAAELERQLAEARRAPAQAPVQQPPRAQPEEDEADRLWQERLSLSEEWGTIRDKATPEMVKRYADRSRKLEWDYNEAMRKRNAPPQEDPNVAFLRSRNHDVISHPEAAAFAQSEVLRAKAAREPITLQTFERAFESARKHFRLGHHANAAPSSESQRSRYAGAPRGGTGGGKEESSRQVKLSKADMKMADAALGHVKDPKLRYRMFAQRVEKRQQKKSA